MKGAQLMLENWTRDVLAENLKTTFQVHHEQLGIVELELIEVSELKKAGRQEAYSIQFCGPLASTLRQGMYKTEHARLGVVDLFIVPIGREEDGLRYEAVFNHLLKQ